MPRLYRSREGAITAVDTKTQLTTLGSETAPGSFLVPANAKRLVGVIVALACDLAVAADGVFFVRLEGNGLPEGPEAVIVGGAGVQVATGGSYVMPAKFIPLDVPVTPSNGIEVFAENAGEDMGTTQVGVTLVYET